MRNKWRTIVRRLTSNMCARAQYFLLHRGTTMYATVSHDIVDQYCPSGTAHSFLDCHLFFSRLHFSKACRVPLVQAARAHIVRLPCYRVVTVHPACARAAVQVLCEHACGVGSDRNTHALISRWRKWEPTRWLDPSTEFYLPSIWYR